MPDLFDLPFEEDPQLEAPLEQPPLEDRPAAARRPLSVTELTIRVRDTLEQQIGEIWVQGELSNCKISNTGHLYFTLKDASSQLRGFMFRSALRYLRFKPTDGTGVVARGRISVYEPKGEYQLVCEHLEPQGLGALQLAFEQLKKRLQAEGLFDAVRKRPLPALPRKIGIVTSLDGAAVRDIVNVLRRRYANLHLVIRPARVQGEGAALEIARAVRAIGRVPGVDAIIVGRGGGSIEDLWAFNEEIVARAISQSPVPIISAVGHETDVTIADFVADVRAATPSAAAELVVSRKDEFCGRIDRLSHRLGAAARGRLQALARRAHMVAGRPAFAAFPARLAMRDRRVSDLTYALTEAARALASTRSRRVQAIDRRLAIFNAGRRLAWLGTRLVSADSRIKAAAVRRRDRARSELHTAVGRLESLNPLAVLARGYAVAWNADKTQVLRDARAVTPGDTVRVTLSHGEIAAKVSQTE